MRILYGFSNCTDKKYNEIMSERNASVLQPDQKYHGLLIKGFSENNVKVKCLSGLPVNRATTSKKIISEQDEYEGNAHFHYYKTLNFPIIRQIMIFFGAFFNVLKEKKSEKPYIICDCLNAANAFGMLLAGKIKGIKSTLIVTDLPYMQTESKLRPWVNAQVFKLADAFILLTEQMNEKVNRKNKPHIVLEGHVDSKLKIDSAEKTEEKNGKKIVIYAGSLHKLYGIENLILGFIKANIENAELHIFGNGDYRDELEKISAENKNVVYRGVCSNQEVVEEELKAALLVNPRPVAPEYTKYSFPSKNMEYMVSATPVLTTNLPGMPKEYLNYVYVLSGESPDEIASDLNRILSLPIEERNALGQSARKFVVENKSNVVQCKKIIEFLNEKIG